MSQSHPIICLGHDLMVTLPGKRQWTSAQALSESVGWMQELKTLQAGYPWHVNMLLVVILFTSVEFVQELHWIVLLILQYLPWTSCALINDICCTQSTSYIQDGPCNIFARGCNAHGSADVTWLLFTLPYSLLCNVCIPIKREGQWLIVLSVLKWVLHVPILTSDGSIIPFAAIFSTCSYIHPEHSERYCS